MTTGKAMKRMLEEHRKRKTLDFCHISTPLKTKDQTLYRFGRTSSAQNFSTNQNQATLHYLHLFVTFIEGFKNKSKKNLPVLKKNPNYH